MIKTPSNEGRCCDAVLRIVEREHGAPRENVDRDTPDRRGIEVTCTIGGQRYAFEHTLIDPFPENQRDGIQFSRVFDAAFEASIADLLKPHLAYTITASVYAFRDLNSKQLAKVRAALLAWARSEVGRLPEPPRGQEAWVRAEKPVCAVLSCDHSKRLGGRLLPRRLAPEDLENLRRERLLKALQDKGPKLHAARGSNTRTVLIVENRDFAITNEVLVRDTFDELCARAQHAPDDIYIVDTRDSGGFYVAQVRRSGQACMRLDDGCGNWEYQATDLTDL